MLAACDPQASEGLVALANALRSEALSGEGWSMAQWNEAVDENITFCEQNGDITQADEFRLLRMAEGHNPDEVWDLAKRPPALPVPAQVDTQIREATQRAELRAEGKNWLP